MLYVPRNFAQGFITLEDETELLYLVSAFYAPDREGGFRYDDEAFGISWPTKPNVISDKDETWTPFDKASMTKEVCR
jgi:dTDP-4-dehydrorhamnose 3,5-epimerase